MTATAILKRLRLLANPRDAENCRRFFKTGPGEYGEGDVFLGIRVPVLRKFVREIRDDVSLETASELLQGKFHEARLLALMLMVKLFEQADDSAKREIYAAYLSHTSHINNWDLVDSSAAPIVGGWLFTRDRRPLYKLAKLNSLWERRIAVIATFHFIRKNDFADTLKLCELLLRDDHDLMHKACGWMLREVGKRDVKTLEAFLEKHAAQMPRTMLRYAIEKFPEPRRHFFLRLGRP